MSLKDFLYRQKKYFDKGAKLEKFEPVYEMVVSFFYPFYEDTAGKTHVRDPLELKRMMTMVVFALIPATIMAFYNTGLQGNLGVQALQNAGAEIPYTWHQSLLAAMHIPFNPDNIFANFMHGLIYFIPVYFITIAIGGFWEVLFSVIRKQPINESFLVTSLIFPLILPPTVPLWQAALAISFGIVFGKELFGGTGKNIVNPALFSRAFLFFAYPASATGEAIWYPVNAESGATPLAILKSGGTIELSWMDAFLGFMPGSMGETSALACIIGAVILVWSGLGSLRIMLSAIGGLAAIVFLSNMVSDSSNVMLQLGLHWHLVLGGFAFGIVFMATDPVSGSFTNAGKIIYGAMIGILTGLVRLVNPAYPEGVMLAILFCNVFIPVVDYFIVKRNIKRREVRCAN